MTTSTFADPAHPTCIPANSFKLCTLKTQKGTNPLYQDFTYTFTVGQVDYTYDNASRRATMTVAGQLAVTYTYDNANRLTQVTQRTGTVTFMYDDADRRTTVIYPNGNGLDYGYDTADQLTSLTYKQGASVLGTLTYSYDVRGNRQVQSGTWARTGLPPVLTTTAYNANNQQTVFDSTTETYDLNGNLATVTHSGVTATYTWNVRNQLTSIMSSCFAASFTYDALGRRTGKTVQGVTTNYVYDELNPVQEKNGDHRHGQSPHRVRDG